MNKKIFFSLSLILVTILYFSILGPTTVNADEGEPATISGYDWHDLDANGIWDAGETGLENWEICAGDVCDITDADGYYELSLPPGSYTVAETCQAGWYQSFPAQTGDVCGSGVHNVTLESQEVDTDSNFGNYQLATKSGYKWNDINPDGEWDIANEPPMSGWTIDLWDVTGTPAFVYSDITDGTGKYEFTEIVPGKTYAVCELLDFNYLQTFPNALTPDPANEQIFDCSTVSGLTYGPYGYQFTNSAGINYEFGNFGNAEPLEEGCTYPKGYWKIHTIYGPASKPDDGWYTSVGPNAPGALGPDKPLFDSGMTWYEVFNTQPKKGNAWYILAHQWMAAYLNFYNGSGSGGVDVRLWLTEGASLLNFYADYDDGSPLIPNDSADFDWASKLADWLEQYNNGYWGPGQCDSES